ncbi:hypothetical protein Glove_281g52 [Diversispora epigaea]|uniref:Uncharacterized protein n=1 Tax=Diversispora epigaea TaxID=1348612 RepID=A0A397I8C5_9GLOM|nr:hypothetical protein Glove_281g52 [Diversispora epigaea]
MNWLQVISHFPRFTEFMSRRFYTKCCLEDASMQFNEEVANIKINLAHVIEFSPVHQVYKDLLSKEVTFLAFYQACIIIEKQRCKNNVFERYKLSNSKRCQSASRMALKTSLSISKDIYCGILYEQALEVVSDPEEFKRRFRELTS